MERADLIDFVTIFSAACNSSDEAPHSEDALTDLVKDMNVVVSVHVDAVLEIMDGFDRGNELNLLFGLAGMLADRSEGQ